MNDRMLCLKCLEPVEPDPAASKPGEIHFHPCPTCGRAGICQEGDKYMQIHRKKANVPPYEKSPYRGGRPR